MFASLLILLPGIYINYLTFRWLYTRNIPKKSRIHKTKITLLLIIICLIVAYVGAKVAFGVISVQSGQLFWINIITYYLFITVMQGLAFLILKTTNSRKNITKLLYVILVLSIYLPCSYWSFQVFQAGTYNGKFGTTRKMAILAVDDYIGNRINHTFKSAKHDRGQWRVVESLSTRDHQFTVDVEYVVRVNDGAVSINNGGKLTTVKLKKNDGSVAGDTEMVLYVEQPANDDGGSNWSAVEYSVTNDAGDAELTLVSNENVNYDLQVRECGVSCQDFYYKLSNPIKSSYDIVLDPYQAGLVEI